MDNGLPVQREEGLCDKKGLHIIQLTGMQEIYVGCENGDEADAAKILVKYSDS
jgi:hypothetical protein